MTLYLLLLSIISFLIQRLDSNSRAFSQRSARSSSLLSSSSISITRYYAAPSVPFKVVTMPALSPTMETGTLLRWAKNEGDTLAPGDLIAEVETDKATIGWESTEDGVLAKIFVAAPAKGLTVGAPVAALAKNASDASQLKNLTLDDVQGKATSAPPPESSPSPAPSEPTPPPTAKASPSKALPSRVLRMPALSPTMEKGTLSKWAKQPGDRIEPGDLIAEVETDKASIGWESTEEGFMAKHLVSAGSVVSLGTPVAVLADKKEEISKWADLTGEDFQERPAAKIADKPTAPTSDPKAASSAKVTPSPQPLSATPSRSSTERVIASPRARFEAQNRGIPIDRIQGTGPQGRIIAADVLDFAASPSLAAQPSTSGVESTKSHSTWSALVSESKLRVPHYYLTIEVRVDALERAVASLKSNAPSVTLNSALVLAASRVMAGVPTVNSEWRGDVIRKHAHVDINIIVQTAEGVATPLIRSVDTLGLRALSESMQRLTEAASKGALSEQDSAIGTFSVLDLSATGVQQCAPIIVPNNAAALCIGSIETRPYLDADGDTLKTSRILVATISCDHRVVDGAVGATWLQQFKGLLEDPLRLLL